MTGIYKIDIAETELELKQLLIKEKIQILYLLKTGKAKTVTQAAEIIGRNLVPVQD